MLPRADYVFEMPAGEGPATFSVEAAMPVEATVLVRGLTRGGAVEVTVNGEPASALELLASGGLEQGKAEAVLITAALQGRINEIAVTETEGAQVVHIPGTQHWFGTATQAAGKPMFSLDLDALLTLEKEYSVHAYFGPGWEPFLWFSGRWDRYYGEVYASAAREVKGSSGATATLAYTLEYPARNLVMPTSITLEPDPATGAYTLRVRQVLRAVGEPSWGDNLEFLHVVINPTYGLDWEDGVPDYTWYRTMREDNPDALPGSHTALCRFDDNSARTYTYPPSTADPTQRSQSGAHHTGAAEPLGARNTIGGFFTKTGVGSCGWVFHRYEASWREDLTPLHSHCGDGADNHFLLFWNELFSPVGMGQGDEVEVEYSLTMLPSEVLREHIEDLNEADLHFFGKAQEQRSEIVGWVGTKEAVGLRRSDGSLLLLGIGREPGRVPVPAETSAQARRSCRAFDLARPRTEPVAIEDGEIEVRPGWITLVDCGSVLRWPE